MQVGYTHWVAFSPGPKHPSVLGPRVGPKVLGHRSMLGLPECHSDTLPACRVAKSKRPSEAGSFMAEEPATSLVLARALSLATPARLAANAGELGCRLEPVCSSG